MILLSNFKKSGRFFQILWPSHNVSTLKICYFRELGLGTNKVYEAGHSLGGIVLETWAKDNADMSTGIILYGSYLANGFGGNGDTNVFPVPVLTAMGSLDGGALSYVTREARESHNPGMIFRIGIFYQNCCYLLWEKIVLSDKEKLMKFEAEG